MVVSETNNTYELTLEPRTDFGPECHEKDVAVDALGRLAYEHKTDEQKSAEAGRLSLKLAFLQSKGEQGKLIPTVTSISVDQLAMLRQGLQLLRDERVISSDGAARAHNWRECAAIAVESFVAGQMLGKLPPEGATHPHTDLPPVTTLRHNRVPVGFVGAAASNRQPA